jgi:hypothetical protein
MLSSNMLLLNLIPLIDVTFSTPTPHCTHLPIASMSASLSRAQAARFQCPRRRASPFLAALRVPVGVHLKPGCPLLTLPWFSHNRGNDRRNNGRHFFTLKSCVNPE